ncbi:MAG: LytTR family DNA-binding domain-containing protein [Oscillospiraceae bacterium]|nr:LytTR family DNA-binding domain-containing protein [Oscillospiraceae bacterium]
MINIDIAIVDDDESMIDSVRHKSNEILNKAGISAHFDGFNLPEKFIEHLKKNSYDLVFLDIEMQPISGEEIAEYITKNSDYTLIIFVTNHDDFAARGYLYSPIAFIRKNRFDEDFEVYKDIILEKLKDIYLYYIIENKTPEKVRIYDICYISSDVNDIIIHTVDKRTIKQRKTLKSFAETNYKTIVQISRDILVNLVRVERLVNTYNIRLDNGETLYISKKYYGNFEKKYFKHAFPKIKVKENGK